MEKRVPRIRGHGWRAFVMKGRTLILKEVLLLIGMELVTKGMPCN